MPTRGCASASSWCPRAPSRSSSSRPGGSSTGARRRADVATHEPGVTLGETAVESVDATVMRVYGDLKRVLGRDDLAPSVRANLIDAMASVSLVVHDLALDYDMLYDLGV